MNKKKVLIIVIIIAVAAACAAGVWYFLTGGVAGGSSKDKVYVEKVSSLIGDSAGVQNRYAGVVESQETEEIQKNQDKEVKELYVAVGDMVEAGTPLFVYDTKETEEQLASEQLNLEQTRTEISSYNSQIASLQQQMAAVSEDEKFNYMTEIQSIQASIKESEYSIKSSETQIEELQKTISESTVVSKIAGVVKSINEEGIDNYGNTSAYISILAVGDYRVKGLVNEQNIWDLTEGTPVIIYSRVSEEQTWTGKLNKIDRDNAESSNSNMEYASDSDSDVTSSSKYPFYVTLDSAEGLMLGQHVYMELDNGQNEKKDGIWLFSSYIVMEDGEYAPAATEGDISGMETAPAVTEGDISGMETAPAVTEGSASGMEAVPAMSGGTAGGDASGISAFVWARNEDSGRLEKRTVMLGAYDAEQDRYEILSGLTEDDYIAWPMDALYEGVATVTDIEEVDYDAPMYSSETEGGYSDGMEYMDPEEDGEMLDDEYMDDEYMDDGELLDDSEMLEDGEMLDDSEMLQNRRILEEDGELIDE